MTEANVNSVTEQSEELLPEHWLDSQRLMVGLTLALVQEAGSATALALMDEALGYLRPPAGAPDPAVETAYLKRLEAIHPATLKRLTDLSPALLPAEWKSHLSYWQEAYVRLQNDGERNPLVGARLIADRIISSQLTPAQIQQLGAAELSPDWQSFVPHKALDSVLRSARAPNRDPHDVLKALARFRKNFLPTRWEIVENALFQQLFIWPLLILETKQTSLEFSLPVLLHVATSTIPLPAIVNAGSLNAEQWEVSIREASKAAKDLWQNKHKSSPPWLKEDLKQLSASVDLAFAARIVKPYQINLRLTGDSAEAYFALAILGAFTDPAAVENVCATGGLGDEKPDREGGGDRKLREPGYVNDKFRYARDSYFFDTFLSPKPSIGVVSQRHIYVPREVNAKFYDPNHTYFSHFCDHVFGQRWRKHQYVRAPDLAEAFKPSDWEERNARKPEDDPQIQRVLKRLRENPKPVLHIDDIPPEKIATALGVVNGKVHWNRLGSYAFLRAVPAALNDRMWWPIWELIRGKPGDFRKFQFAASSRLAAEALAGEMNKVSPNKADPRRAPDVLVVAYTSVHHHYISDPAIPGSPFERLRIKPMIEAMNSLPSSEAIVRSRVPGLHEHIGQTRVVFVRDPIGADGLISGELSDSSFEEEVRDALNRLSIFRYGFKREHARHVLNVTEDECDRILTKLRIPAPDNGSLLVYAEGAGEYYLTRQISHAMAGKELAELHFDAANSMTGLLAPRDGSFRTNLRDAFSPRWAQETQWHLEEAHRLTDRKDTNRRGELRRAQQRSSRLAEPFGWTNVRWWIRAMRGVRLNNLKPIPEADFLLDALRVHFQNRLPGTREFLGETHPIEYVLAARYCNELTAQKDVPAEQRANYLKLRDEYIDFGWTRIHADTRFSDYEYKTCIFIQFASEFCMKIVEDINNSFTLRANYLERRIEDFLGYQNFIDYTDIELFEYMGDRIDQADQALRWYKMAVFNPRINSTSLWPSLAFKFAGAAKVAGVMPPEEAKSALDRFRLKSNANKMPPVGGLYTLPRVKQRWEIGRCAILEGDYEFRTDGMKASS